jgi:hypothetical protein
MAAHWGVIFEYGKYYDYTIYEKEVTFVTNFKVWNNSLSEIVQNGFEIMKLKNKDIDSTWLVSKNKVLEKIKKECEKTLSLPHLMIKSDDRDTVHYFLTLSDDELYQLGADMGKNEKPYFTLSVHRVDDYFDYKSERRDNKLNELLK